LIVLTKLNQQLFYSASCLVVVCLRAHRQWYFGVMGSLVSSTRQKKCLSDHLLILNRLLIWTEMHEFYGKISLKFYYIYLTDSLWRLDHILSGVYVNQIIPDASQTTGNNSLWQSMSLSI